jgi:hypothetical protein
MIKTLFVSWFGGYATLAMAGVVVVGITGAWFGVSTHYYNQGWNAHKKVVDDANAAAKEKADKNRIRPNGPADCNERNGMFYNSATGNCERVL